MNQSKEIDIALLSRLINIGALTALLTVCLIGYYVVCWRCSDRVTQLNNQADELQSSLNQVAFVKVRFKQLSKLKQEHDQKLNALVPPAYLEGRPHLTQFIEGHLRKANMQTTEIVSSPSTLPLTSETISVTAKGSYAQTCRFLNNTDPLPANVRLEVLKINSDQQSASQVQMRFGLEIEQPSRADDDQLSTEQT